MQTNEPDYLPIEVSLLRHVIREAALRIVSRHGDDMPSSSSENVRRAIRSGFVVTHRIAEPGTIRRRQGYWNTASTWNETDAMQQTIEVQAGEDLIVLGWRGSGQIAHDRLHRGPWEYHLLQEACMSVATRRTARLPHVMPLGQTGLSWAAGHVGNVRTGRLRNDIIFDVHGTRGCIRDTAPAGSTMSDLIERLRLADAAHLWPSKYGLPGEEDRTSFTLRARSNFKASGPHQGVDRKFIRYWVGYGGVRSAAQLLLRLDRECS